MSTPTVSVLVPVCNGGPFLGECIESILAQDYHDYELLISDDASTDDSSAVIQHYARKDRRIRWWRNPRNLGIGGNWNACLRAAQGQYIKYVLQDDKLIEPSALRRLLATVEENPSIALAASVATLIDAQSQPIRTRCFFLNSGVWEGRPLIIHCLNEQANVIGEPSLALFRKAQAARGFDERFKQLLDLEMWFHLLEQGDFAYIAEPLCAFRLHSAQLTEANRRAGACQDEEVLLMESCCAKPWLKLAAANDPNAQRMLCSQRYYLRKRHGQRAAAVLEELSRILSRRHYAEWWVRHKVTRPFSHLRKWFLKRSLLKA